MSSDLTEGEKFFEEHGYYYTKFVPREKSPPTPTIGVSGPESEFGPFVWSHTSGSFHRPDCKWAKKINRLDKIFGSHADAIRDGKKPCKYGCKS